MLSSVKSNTSTRSSCSCNPWKMEYDPILQQYYYINMEDNTISFDSPFEVVNHKKAGKSLFSSFKKTHAAEKEKPCPFSSSSSSKSPKSRSIYRRLSDALSSKSTKSDECHEDVMMVPENTPRTSIVSTTTTGTTLTNNSQPDVIDQYTLIDTGNFDEEYLLNNNKINHFKNFTGTSQVNLGYITDIEQDPESADSIISSDDEDEIQVFNQKYIYNPNYDNAFFDYEDDECNANEEVDMEKENERRELRIQMLKELY
ncbi:hypothetical protein SBY92_002855 [Candida maltosa Xu316]|uniref:WW domain-containing protein n=1 Tax=Candida maltosa (strain Xu316) TaxID=1245528 RepID=M3JY65_CANMX|nr:hypothetical protein G210_2318 [Candida maltosa Xu316]